MLNLPEREAASTRSLRSERRLWHDGAYRALEAQAREREGFAPLFRVVVRDNGREYTRLVLEALDRERITPADVSDYLGVRLKHLDDIAGAVERVGARG